MGYQNRGNRRNNERKRHRDAKKRDSSEDTTGSKMLAGQQCRQKTGIYEETRQYHTRDNKRGNRQYIVSGIVRHISSGSVCGTISGVLGDIINGITSRILLGQIRGTIGGKKGLITADERLSWRARVGRRERPINYVRRMPRQGVAFMGQIISDCRGSLRAPRKIPNKAYLIVGISLAFLHEGMSCICRPPGCISCLTKSGSG